MSGGGQMSGASSGMSAGGIPNNSAMPPIGANAGSGGSAGDVYTGHTWAEPNGMLGSGRVMGMAWNMLHPGGASPFDIYNGQQFGAANNPMAAILQQYGPDFLRRTPQVWNGPGGQAMPQQPGQPMNWQQMFGVR